VDALRGVSDVDLAVAAAAQLQVSASSEDIPRLVHLLSDRSFVQSPFTKLPPEPANPPIRVAMFVASPHAHTSEEQGGQQPPHIDSSMRSRGGQMFLNIIHTIADFIVLVTRLATEELTDEQRIVLIDQFIHIQGLDVAFEFNLHDLLMIPIMALIIIFWSAWNKSDRWPYR
jgi:hypothetical protein